MSKMVFLRLGICIIQQKIFNVEKFLIFHTVTICWSKITVVLTIIILGTAANWCGVRFTINIFELQLANT